MDCAHQALMDRIYRSQKGIYDFTRKYYLLGRDTLLTRLSSSGCETVLEMGCGTARNLVKLAALSPKAQLYGIDASSEMLEQARRSVNKAGRQSRIHLACALAEQTDPQALFGLKGPVDAVFFSYSLSMIPTWREAIDKALTLVEPGGVVMAVDFWDQAAWPRWFQAVLRAWLKLFHVEHRPELLDYFAHLANDDQVSLSLEPVFGRYAYIATLKKR